MAKIARRGDRHSPEYNREFHRENYVQVNLKIRKDSGIIEALNLMTEVTGMPKTEYIRDAVQDRLREDGYMPEK